MNWSFFSMSSLSIKVSKDKTNLFNLDSMESIFSLFFSMEEGHLRHYLYIMTIELAQVHISLMQSVILSHVESHFFSRFFNNFSYVDSMVKYSFICSNKTSKSNLTTSHGTLLFWSMWMIKASWILTFSYKDLEKYTSPILWIIWTTKTLSNTFQKNYSN